MAADEKTQESEDPSVPGMGSALIAIFVMLFSAVLLAVLIYLVMLPIQAIPRHHPKAESAESVPAPVESQKKLPTTPPAR
jgi:hypothetical protein